MVCACATPAAESVSNPNRLGSADRRGTNVSRGKAKQAARRRSGFGMQSKSAVVGGEGMGLGSYRKTYSLSQVGLGGWDGVGGDQTRNLQTFHQAVGTVSYLC